MQTILGAGGPVGNSLAQELMHYTSKIRLVSRSPEKVNFGDELFPADLLNSESVSRAVEGSQIVYLTAGLPYDYKVWRREWPVIMRNTIAACEKHRAKLVFFDNIYMYSEEEIPWMTEDAKVAPPSRKGRVRAEISEMILQKIHTGNLKALIARSADFYGPGCAGKSMLMETVFTPLAKGKKANWLGLAQKRHSFTYLPDAAKATALLGNSETAYEQVWHLPTASDPPTGIRWVEMIAKELKVAPEYRQVPKNLVKVMGWFMPLMRETVEMMYQYDRDYIFDSSKIEKAYNLKPTPYEEGIRETIQKDYTSSL